LTLTHVALLSVAVLVALLLTALLLIACHPGADRRAEDLGREAGSGRPVLFPVFLVPVLAALVIVSMTCSNIGNSG
jgi:hypothetical protein